MSAVSVTALESGPQSQVAKAWVHGLATENSLVRADQLYKGRAFITARAAAAALGADFGVISAGLGYIAGDRAVPGYDLTVSALGEASVQRRVTGRFSASAWWSEVRQGPFASDLVEAAAKRPSVLIAISQSYLQMAAEDLLAIEAAAPGVLRLFGMSLDRVTPEALRVAIMPYDMRLERLGRPGTRTDFAPRALKHFVDHIFPTAEGREDQRLAVLAAMTGAPAAAHKRAQKRIDDEALKVVIRRLVQTEGDRGAAVLRALRHGEGLSCEQARFAGLFRAVRQEGERRP